MIGVGASRWSGLVAGLVGSMVWAAVPAPGHAEELLYPLSVAVAGDDALLVADRMLPGLLKVNAGTTEVFFQGKKTFRTPLNAVRAVAVAADGTVHAADSATRDVFKFVDGQPIPLTQGKIGIPVDIAFDPSGDLFVSDLETQRIWRVPAAGGEPKEVAQLAAPRGLFVDGTGRLWAVAASGEQPLVRIAADGSVEPVVKERVFEFPHDVVVADDGTAYVSDNYARAVWKVAADGSATKWITGEPLKGPVGLSIRGGKLLIADPQAKTVWEADSEGKLTSIVPAAK
jgi:DNA-binding beta-propeller fold protein YncE